MVIQELASEIIVFWLFVGLEVKENQAPRYLNGLDLLIAFIFSLLKVIVFSSEREFVASIDFDGLTLILANL